MCKRCSSDVASQTIANEAKADLANLRCKNERSFSFEKFSAKLQWACDNLEEQGRPVNNGNIVDELWPRIQAPALGQCVAALKVQCQQAPRECKLILQDIASEAGNQTKTVTFAPGTCGISATHTRQGNAPTSGVSTVDGSIFIGSYDKEKWFSDSVKQCHQEIINARGSHSDSVKQHHQGITNPRGSNDGGGKRQESRGQKRRANAIKRSKKRLKSLKAKIAAAKIQLKDDSDDDKDSNQDDKDADNNAGNAFGGRRGKKKRD